VDVVAIRWKFFYRTSLWVARSLGWTLELGWKEAEMPDIAEKELKRRYKELHGGKLPALVQR
jgi:hypothetical protein